MIVYKLYYRVEKSYEKLFFMPEKSPFLLPFKKIEQKMGKLHIKLLFSQLKISMVRTNNVEFRIDPQFHKRKLINITLTKIDKHIIIDNKSNA
mgnify:CR=1 FL=1